MYNINALTYTAHENPEWFTRSAFGGRLIRDGIVRALTGIKGDELLNQIGLENSILQIDGKDCAWTPNQIIKLSEKRASIKTYKINLEQCIDDLEDKRTAYMLSPGANNEELPAELEDATLYLISIELSNEIEKLIVAGNSATNPNEFDGMQTILLNSNEAIQIAGTTLTKSNILDEFEKAVGAIPENVLQAEDAGALYGLISYKARRLLRSALGVASNQVLYPEWSLDDTDKRNPRVYYGGVEFVAVKGIETNTAIIFDSRNAYLLTDLLSDLDGIELGQFPKPQENKIFIKGRMRLGFVIPFEDEAVIYSPEVESDRAGDGAKDLDVVPNSLVFDVEGETKTFNIITADPNADVEVNASNSGFTVTKGATTEVGGFGVTTVTVTPGTSVVADIEVDVEVGEDSGTGEGENTIQTSEADNTGNRDPRVGQVIVRITGTDRTATVTLNQRNSDTVKTSN